MASASDILTRQIAREMAGPRIDISGSLTEAEIRESYEFQLENLTRLTAAIGILFPDAQQPGEGTIDCAIRLLEERKATT